MPTTSLNTVCRPRFAFVPRFLSLQNLILFPHVGRQQKAEGVRKLVTRRYPYLVYYTTDEEAEEIVILPIQHRGPRA